MSGRFRKPDATGRSSSKISGRRGKLMKPPAGEPFVWLTRELLASDAWRSLSINARRFIDFLLIENMNHAGTENGNLRATYGQLQTFGIGARFVAAAIQEAENVGLVDCSRGGMRVATTYALTFYPHRDGTPASNRWKRYQKQKSASPREGSKPSQGKADGTNLPYQGKADPASPREGPSISSLARTNVQPYSSSLSVSRHHATAPGAEQIDIEEAIAAAKVDPIAAQPPNKAISHNDFAASGSTAAGLRLSLKRSPALASGAS